MFKRLRRARGVLEELWTRQGEPKPQRTSALRSTRKPASRQARNHSSIMATVVVGSSPVAGRHGPSSISRHQRAGPTAPGRCSTSAAMSAARLRAAAYVDASKGLGRLGESSVVSTQQRLHRRRSGRPLASARCHTVAAAASGEGGSAFGAAVARACDVITNLFPAWVRTGLGAKTWRRLRRNPPTLEPGDLPLC